MAANGPLARFVGALLLAGVLALSGCARPAPPVSADPTAAETRAIAQAEALTLAPTSAESALARNRAICAGLNGAYERGGRAGYLRCVLTFSDAGKACSDGGDCKGDCLARGEGSGPDASPGVCQATTSRFGCRSKVEQGRVAGGICID